MALMTSPDGDEILDVPTEHGARALRALGWTSDEGPAPKKTAAKKTATAKPDKE